MSQFESEAAAAEALAAASNADHGVTAPEQAPVAAESNVVDAGTNQSSESFTNFDINSVPEELRPLVEEKFNQFNADYTRKTQEVAPFRKALEENGFSVEEAQQALQFVRSLDDPDTLRQLYEHLSPQFEAETEHIDEAGEVDPRDNELKSLSERLARFEQEQAMGQARIALDASVAAVKEAHPDFGNADIERIQQLAISRMQSGDGLEAAMSGAAKEYASWRETTINDYIARKGAVGANGAPPLGTSTHADTPTGPFPDLDAATKAALARFGNI